MLGRNDRGSQLGSMFDTDLQLIVATLSNSASHLSGLS